jgi:DNA-binding NtrC family response regulator
MRKELSLAPFSVGWGASNQPMAERSSSTRSVIFPPRPRSRSCVCCKSGKFERTGSSEPIFVDIRVVAATNRDLEAAVAAGTFRQDLFYCLNAFPLRVPSLRERKSNIPLLVEYLVERYAKRIGKKISRVKKKPLDLFQEYDWPGNVCELQNVIERAVMLCEEDTFYIDESWLRSKSDRTGDSVLLRAGGLAENSRFSTWY